MRLRPRQKIAVERSLKALAAHGNSLLVAPTGAGKTIMLSSVAGQRLMEDAPRPNKTLILQHRDELIAQNASKFHAVNPKLSISLVDADTKNWNGQAVFAMVQTLVREKNLAQIPRLGTLIIDEAHHAPANSYQAIIERVQKVEPGCAIFGVTATPNRGDGVGLRGTFDNVSDQITISELIGSGHLVRPRTFVLDVGAQEALKGVRRLTDDFDMNAVSNIMDRDVITDQIIAHWKDKAHDRQTVAFASTVAHARHVAEAFCKAGVKAEIIHGELSSTEREAVLKRYDSGATQMVVNVAVLTEGWDHPPTSCVMLLRPSSYKSTMIQMIGRGLRVVDPNEYPGVIKIDCLVLDFGTATLQHGKIEEDVDLDGKTGQVGDGTKECPACHAEVPNGVMECPFCGYVWPKKSAGAPKAFDVSIGEVMMNEIDLLNRSSFAWVDIWGDDFALMATGFDCWAGIYWWEGLWHAIGGTKTSIRHLGLGDRLVCIALGDDFMSAHEDSSMAHKSKRWLREPATDKQLNALGLSHPEDGLTKYKAACRLSFRYNKLTIQNIVRNYAQTKAA